MTENTLQILGYKYEIAVDSKNVLWHADHGFSLSFSLFDRSNQDPSSVDISEAQSYFLQGNGDPENVMSSLGYLLRHKYENVLADVFIIAAGADRGLPASNVEHLRLSPSSMYHGVFDLTLAHEAGAKKVAQINLAVDR